MDELSLFSVTAIIFTSMLWLFQSIRHRRPLPPGPRGLPILGNVLQLPQGKEWDTFQVWRETYGDIMQLKVFSRPLILLNSYKAAVDLTVKRSAIYSSRPNLMMACELVRTDLFLPLMPYGDDFRFSRKSCQRQFHAGQVPSFHPDIEAQTRRLLERLVNDSTEFKNHIRLTVTTIILQLTHGRQVRDEDDEFYKEVEDAARIFSALVAPAAFFVDFLHFLRFVPSWFPGASFKRKAKEWRHRVETTPKRFYNIIKTEMENGIPNKSYLGNRIQEAKDQHEEDVLAYTAIGLGVAGSDAPVSALLFFFLAMTVNPGAQQQAQEEIDAVIGPDRLPTMADRPSLPFVDCIVKEILRWYPVSPLGVPHKVTQDDEYNGYFIPAGTTIILNQYAMLHDPSVYPQPDQFLPERFLPSDDPMADQAKDPHNIAFGFGRRQCPGIHTASSLLFCIVANVLATHNISRPISKETGKEYDPEVGCTLGNLSFPLPYDCTIRPRSDRAVHLISISTEWLF